MIITIGRKRQKYTNQFGSREGVVEVEGWLCVGQIDLLVEGGVVLAARRARYDDEKRPRREHVPEDVRSVVRA